MNEYDYLERQIPREYSFECEMYLSQVNPEPEKGYKGSIVDANGIKHCFPGIAFIDSVETKYETLIPREMRKAYVKFTVYP